MNKKDGKATFSTLVFIILIFYGGYVAVMLISAKITESQIESDIIDRFGILRGPDFSEDKAATEIRKILKKNGAVLDEADKDSLSVRIHSNRIEYFCKYTVETNLIAFKKIKQVVLKNNMPNHD